MRMCEIYHTSCQPKSETKNVRNAQLCGSTWLSRRKLAKLGVGLSAGSGAIADVAGGRRRAKDQEQQDPLRPAPSHTANHIDRACNAMTKIGLTNSANQFA